MSESSRMLLILLLSISIMIVGGKNSEKVSLSAMISGGDAPIFQKVSRHKKQHNVNVSSPSLNSTIIAEQTLSPVSATQNNTQVSIPLVSNPINTTTSQPIIKKKLFYMYDLPEEYWWRWPANSTAEKCRANGYLGVEHALLSGIGMPISPDDGLFLTWHFSMFNSLHNRFKRSSRRTKNPAEASVFIIPYDIGLDGYLNPHNCGNRKQCTDGLIGKLNKIILEQPYYSRNEGADHVLLWSLGQYHPWPRAGCDLFMMKFCSRCTITCYWSDPTKAENRFVSMPFPAAYHWWDGIKHLPWDTSRAQERNITAVYLGSTLTLNPTHTKIRRAMAAQCNASTLCHWKKIAHSSIDNKIGDLLSVYKNSIFCLCPPGDDPARKAVFDAIVSGCIPVIFEVATLYNQYPWHIGEQAALDVTVYVPGGLVRSGKLDFMTVLQAIPPDVISKKQQALAELAPRVQYAIPPYHLLENRFDETVWDPPFHDAAEIALDGFFDRAEKFLANKSTNIPHRLMTGREWGQEYEVAKVQVPRGQLKFGPEVNARSSSEAISMSALDNSNYNAGVPFNAAEHNGHHRKGNKHHRSGGKGGAGGGGGKHHQQGMEAPGEEENRQKQQ